MAETKLKIVQRTLQEVIGVLEESKHVFKSKRLGELRKQFQDLLDDLEKKKPRLALRKF